MTNLHQGLNVYINT